MKMYTTFMERSWQAPERFANLVLTKGDDSELATALLIVYNYTDTVIDNLQVTFTNSAGNEMERLAENDTYIDTQDKGVKRMMIPPYLLMNALVANGTMTIMFDTQQGRLEMVGHRLAEPHDMGAQLRTVGRQVTELDVLVAHLDDEVGVAV